MKPNEARQTVVNDSLPGGSARVAVRFRAAMLIGAGLVIGVWLFAGLFFSRRIVQVQERTAVISQRYLRAQQLLAEARHQVLLGSIYLREALLDPGGGPTAGNRSRVSEALDVAEDNLSQYEPVLEGSDEVFRVQRLRGELADLRREMEDVLATDPAVWPSVARDLLRGRLTPRRAEVIRVADEIGTLNRTAFVEHQAETARVYRTTQNQVWQVLGLAVATSLGIALFAARYGGRLERRVAEQQARDAEMQADLQRLSAALIQAREDERRVVARELHDEIGQLLTVTKVELAMAQRAVERSGDVSRLDEARTVVDRALHAVRDLSHLLHPAMLDDLGLVAAVDWQIRAFRKRYEVDVAFEHAVAEPRLPPEVERAAYRIVQESLTNVAKHAKARRCTVTLRRDERALTVEIDDDGRGFDAKAVNAASGLGLVSMRERATQLGGSIVIESGDGQGTRIVAHLPIAQAAVPTPVDRIPS